jgi:hypothetical protein
MALRMSLVQGSAPKMPRRRLQARGSRPWRSNLVGDGQHVAGRDHDDVGLEVGDQLHLALGLAAAERHHRQAQRSAP